MGLIGLFALGTATAVTSADLLNFDNGLFYVDTSAAIGPDAAFDNGDQSGDLSDNPFDAVLSSSSSWGLFTANGAAEQHTAWSGNSINTLGASSASITGGPGSLGGLFWDVQAYSESMFEFHSDVDVTYHMHGEVLGTLASVTLIDGETGATLHSVESGTFTFTGTLFADVHYQLISSSSSVLHSNPALIDESSGFEVTFDVIPAPGAFGLLVVAGIARFRRRRD